MATIRCFSYQNIKQKTKNIYRNTEAIHYFTTYDRKQYYYMEIGVNVTELHKLLIHFDRFLCFFFIMLVVESFYVDRRLKTILCMTNTVF